MADGARERPGASKKLRRRLLTALWVGQEPPAEYVDLCMCRDVYHCTPAELARQDAVTIACHLAMIAAEARVRQEEARSK